MMDGRIERATEILEETGDIEWFLWVISYKWDKNHVLWQTGKAIVGWYDIVE